MKHNWCPEYEKMLGKWRAKLFVQMWLNQMTGYYYDTIRNWLTFPVIIVSSASSATFFVSNNCKVQFAMAILSSVNIFITGILLEMAPGQKIEQHINVMKQCKVLTRTIDCQLSFPYELRDDALKFIEKLNLEIENVAESEELIPKFIIHKFEKKYGNIDSIMFGDEVISLIKLDLLTKKSSQTFDFFQAKFAALMRSFHGMSTLFPKNSFMNK